MEAIVSKRIGKAKEAPKQVPALEGEGCLGQPSPSLTSTAQRAPKLGNSAQQNAICLISTYTQPPYIKPAEKGCSRGGAPFSIWQPSKGLSITTEPYNPVFIQSKGE